LDNFIFYILPFQVKQSTAAFADFFRTAKNPPHARKAWAMLASARSTKPTLHTIIATTKSIAVRAHTNTPKGKGKKV
jgi:hypothetical protein